MEREKGRGCLATRRLPWPETCGTETGIIKEQLHDDGQGDESGVIGKYMGLKISLCSESSRMS